MSKMLRWSEEALSKHLAKIGRVAPGRVIKLLNADAPIRRVPTTEAESKFGNRKVDAPEGKFDSEKEHRRYQELLLLEKAGQISQLRRQVKFELAPGYEGKGRKHAALRYFADFVYLDAYGKQICEDCKGFRTDVYRIKRHLMRTVHGIDILET